jgi:hypothetical protein
MFEDEVCKRNYKNGDAQFAEGMKVMTVTENHRVEQRGPPGINQLRKNRDITPNMERR